MMATLDPQVLQCKLMFARFWQVRRDGKDMGHDAGQNMAFRYDLKADLGVQQIFNLVLNQPFSWS